MAFNIGQVKQAMRSGMGMMSGPGRLLPNNPAIGDLHTDTSGEVFVYTQQGWISNSGLGATGQITNGQLPISNTITNGGHFITAAAVKPSPTITMKGKLGDITINLDTGELTMPPKVGRDDAIRDFWLGFQEYYQPTNKAEYEKKINHLEYDVTEYKRLWKEAEKNSNKKVADKVRTKYNGQKLIMVKPEDLAKFIEES
jgi:hypothetical protein